MNAADRKPSDACPTYFRALCRTASSGRHGGYRSAGYQLAGGLADLAPADMEDEGWLGLLSELADLIAPPGRAPGSARPADDGPILAWFVRWLPRCMALVPPRARVRFLEGVYVRVIDEETDIAKA